MIKLGVYKHYKGNYYRVIGIAKHSETLEDMVVYQGLYENGGLWVRPLSMWEEQVGDTLRFTYVGEDYEVQ
ncbi:MAG: DUF1653 domain-containing protein [Ruminococcaceae bacterium]|nr:DUF1653 domain-containing protein [Oscillospiraceae bacterium]